MAVYLAFSDECGNYNPTNRSKEPYYIRATVLIEAHEWLKLRDCFFRIKCEEYRFPKTKEIKWSYLFPFAKYKKHNQPIPCNKPFHFLADTTVENLFAYIDDVCALLTQSCGCKLIYTITDNRFTRINAPEKIYTMHLENIMQRIEMEMQIHNNSLAILFFDSISQRVDKVIRSAYQEISRQDRFIKEFRHIKDCILFEDSSESYAMQLADYAAGIMYGFLRNFAYSKQLFTNVIYRLIRKNRKGNCIGYGIIDVPSNSSVRASLRDKLVQSMLRHQD